MHTGRNLNLFSWAIVIYLLSGADIQSLGISGVGLKFEHPDVIKFSAILLWVWMLLSHFFTRGKGEYYGAWEKNAKGIIYNALRGEMTPEHKETVISEIKKFFGKDLENIMIYADFGLSYLNDIKNKCGIYVVQRIRERVETKDIIPGGQQYKFVCHPVSKRYSALDLYIKFPGVFFKVLTNDADVFLRRVIPWISAFIALTLLIINTKTDVSNWYLFIK